MKNVYEVILRKFPPWINNDGSTDETDDDGRVLWIASEGLIELAPNSEVESVRVTGILPEEEGVDLIVGPTVSPIAGVKPKVFIDITGGLVQYIGSEIDLDVTVVDYEDVSKEEANARIHGDLAYANVEFPVDVDPETVKELHRQAAKDYPEVDLRTKAKEGEADDQCTTIQV